MSMNPGTPQGVGHPSLGGLTLPHESDALTDDTPEATVPPMVKTGRNFDAERHATASLDAKIRACLVPGLRSKPRLPPG